MSLTGWHSALPGLAEYQRIALPQPAHAQPQPAQLVLAIGIGSSHIAKEIGGELAQARTERLIKPGKIFRVGGAIRQVHIDRRGWLMRRVVVLLMKRDRENLIIVRGIMVLLVIGVRESARFNATMVFIKLAAVLFFILVGVWYVNRLHRSFTGSRYKVRCGSKN